MIGVLVVVDSSLYAQSLWQPKCPLIRFGTSSGRVVWSPTSNCAPDRRSWAVKGAKPQSSRALADELAKRGVLTEWQADNLMQGKHRGFHLGPYRILRPLGQGGMSKVFLAEHE